jgi:hypothetical protein
MKSIFPGNTETSRYYFLYRCQVETVLRHRLHNAKVPIDARPAINIRYGKIFRRTEIKIPTKIDPLKAEQKGVSRRFNQRTNLKLKCLKCRKFSSY